MEVKPVKRNLAEVNEEVKKPGGEKRSKEVK